MTQIVENPLLDAATTFDGDDQVTISSQTEDLISTVNHNKRVNVTITKECQGC